MFVLVRSYIRIPFCPIAIPTTACPLPYRSSPLSGNNKKPLPDAANVSGFAHKDTVNVLNIGCDKTDSGTTSLNHP